MLVVSDTSPINYLVLIQQETLLPILYERVVIPPAVYEELQRSQTPEAVWQWIAHPPAWLSVQRPLSVRQFPRLEDGELEAIPLAQELGASFLLMDDFEGREEAERRALTVTGTLGVLETTAIRGLIACPLFWSSFRRQRFMPHNVSMTRCWPAMRPASLARQRTGVDGAVPLRSPVACLSCPSHAPERPNSRAIYGETPRSCAPASASVLRSVIPAASTHHRYARSRARGMAPPGTGAPVLRPPPVRASREW